MKQLDTLLKNLDNYELHGSAKAGVSAICFDSRAVNSHLSGEYKPLYVAQHGEHIDGHLFIEQAIAEGAGTVVCEVLPAMLHNTVTYIVTPNAQIALGRLASAFYDYPSRKLKVVGITGTNGKTTTVTLLYKLFSDLGYPVGMISTIENKICRKSIPATHTTPDAVALNALLSDMVEAGCEFCFMEVSSHAICQHRIEGVHYTGAIFSNITHDHLDFHKTFAGYIQAKKAFFDALPKEAFVLTNRDDKNGLVMMQNTKAQIYTYSLQQMADFKGKLLNNSFEGLQLVINGWEIHGNLCGKFNAYNILAIYGTAILLGAESEELLPALSALESATGRFQLVRNPRGAIAIVDYAHTPDALKNVLSTIRDISQNGAEIITVVGCGGDRDALKRSIMAKIACEYSNKVILTSDNPRTEDPMSILIAMQKGVPLSFKQNVLTIENRHEAIKTACMLLPANGILLVAGKGHETYQEIKGVKHYFNDMEEISNLFENLNL
ncbi:MAG: UDP-N-acetylmuramoyl-L-alanyl-D-glutamate--2,6-diaminopimelate ligase [Bacteroidales bacterium]|jgi:UDP-N-acetylmuramoyl-L-alanyl-D-glutamate--2,6-diaminopimelate ligase|nr:UDP-N-acetylmuramoyl-L-alanyl-D-glutamate--2,6-diaminopimelate ligase [Bacteroidales bacterium]